MIINIAAKVIKKKNVCIFARLKNIRHDTQATIYDFFPAASSLPCRLRPNGKATSASGIQKQKEELCRILDELQQAHFNTVLFQTRLRGDVVYPSAFEPFAESLTGTEGRNPGYDPLRFAIEECHKRGMELHAWIVAIPIGNARQVRTLGRNALGRNALNRKHPSFCKQFKGSWYLDPGNPAVDDYLASIVREIVSGYV